MADLTIAVEAITMEGLPAQDPQVTIILLQTSDPQQVIRKWVLSFDGTAEVTCPGPENTFPTWQVAVGFSRFSGGNKANLLFMPRGQSKVAMNLDVVRSPGQWSPDFDALAELPAPRFDPFRGIVGQSDSVDLLDGTDLGALAAAFDGLTGAPRILAKTALLNLFSVLGDERDPVSQIQDDPGVAWFSYVRKFVRIGQERFVAELNDGTLFENISTILKSPQLIYKGTQYATELDGGRSMHLGNIPAKYNAPANLVDMKTVKIPYEQGNVQLTVSFLRVDGVAVHLLDCDMDEHLNLLKHGFDLLAHIFDGGTNPITMHEYIVRDSAQNSPQRVSTVELGYKLV